MCKLDITNRCEIVSIDTIKQIIKNKTFFVEYQPFISVDTGEIYAYEALARFIHNKKIIAPDVLLQVCHQDKKLFSELEYILKEYQFKNRPRSKKLFVNFDVHSICKKDQINRFIELFNNQKNFVIELVENSYQRVNLEKLVEIFRKFQFEFAVDDFFKEDSVISLFLLNNCDYLKLDKDILYQLKTNKPFSHIVKGIVEFVHSQNKKVVLEGVEETSELDIAKTLGIDFVQGFLYKDRFINR